MLKLLIDSLGMDPGNAFVYCDAGSDPSDKRIDGRFGRNSPKEVYLETYSSADLGETSVEFDSVHVVASSRKAAIVKLLAALGYPRGTKFEVRYETT